MVQKVSIRMWKQSSGKEQRATPSAFYSLSGTACKKFSYSYKCYDSTASSFHLTFSVNKHALMDFLTKKRQHNSNKKVFQNLFLEGKQSKCMKKQKRNKKRKNKQKTVKNFQTA